jgi:hypothetical protein
VQHLYKSREDRRLSTNAEPLFKRISLRLKKHGLSFGDALNLALFVLTILSIVVAFLAVYYARVAMKDARHEADVSRQRSKDDAADQADRFDQQMDQLQTTAEILAGIQKYAVKNEVRNVKKDKARPLPSGTIGCNSVAFLSMWGTNITSNKALHTRLRNGEIICWVDLANEGDAELSQVRWKLDANCRDSSEGVFVAQEGKRFNEPQGRISLEFDAFPPKEKADKSSRKIFILRPSNQCPSMILNSQLFSNFDNVESRTFIEVTPIPK